MVNEWRGCRSHTRWLSDHLVTTKEIQNFSVSSQQRGTTMKKSILKSPKMWNSVPGSILDKDDSIFERKLLSMGGRYIVQTRIPLVRGKSSSIQTASRPSTARSGRRLNVIVSRTYNATPPPVETLKRLSGDRPTNQTTDRPTNRPTDGPTAGCRIAQHATENISNLRYYWGRCSFLLWPKDKSWLRYANDTKESNNNADDIFQLHTTPMKDHHDYRDKQHSTATIQGSQIAWILNESWQVRTPSSVIA